MKEEREPLLPVFILPKAWRRDFSQPRGIIVKGRLDPFLEGSPEPIICVGDVVSMYCKSLKAEHIVLIVDKKTRRRDITGELEIPESYTSIEIRNPAGTLSHDAIKTICKITRDPRKWYVYVVGEEDMTALAAIACSPGKGTIVYGVPGKGATIIVLNIYNIREAQSRILELKPALLALEKTTSQ